MAGDPRKPPADDVRNPEAPEAVNREQRDDDAQAQTVAEAARHGRRLEDSKKPPGRDERDDVQDLVDHMRQMERSDRKSTRLNSVTNAHLVCRLLLEKKKQHTLRHK